MFHFDHGCKLICEPETCLLSMAMGQVLFTLIINKICIQAPENMRNVATALDLDFPTISY